jgi:solute carrier family 25 protein 39/40
MSIPATIVYFVGYENLRDLIFNKVISDHASMQTVVPLTAGIAARTMTASLVSPIELVRTRMQSSHTTNLPRVLSDLWGLVRIHGVKELYRGLSPTLWRDVPFSGLYWVGVETLKRRWLQDEYRHLAARVFNLHGHVYDVGVAFAAGATSGMIAAVLTTPFDVAKTHMQIDMERVSRASHTASPPTVPGMLSVMRRILVLEGFKGLWRGVVPRVAKVSPACAIMIGSYEAGKQLFK